MGTQFWEHLAITELQHVLLGRSWVGQLTDQLGQQLRDGPAVVQWARPTGPWVGPAQVGLAHLKKQLKHFFLKWQYL